MLIGGNMTIWSYDILKPPDLSPLRRVTPLETQLGSSAESQVNLAVMKNSVC
ncbi:hypothetical protein PF003_g3675 [Phytophthora fragariae]|nr:hypothetical protein PF003_g3675 [Phytophthora fragariae]